MGASTMPSIRTAAGSPSSAPPAIGFMPSIIRTRWPPSARASDRARAWPLCQRVRAGFQRYARPRRDPRIAGQGGGAGGERCGEGAGGITRTAMPSQSRRGGISCRASQDAGRSSGSSTRPGFASDFCIGKAEQNQWSEPDANVLISAMAGDGQMPS
jgi:hypothetical protein